jgi:zinc protease
MTRWYRPERTTLLVAGDVDPAILQPAIAAEFAAWRPAGRRARDADPGIRSYRTSRAAVITDPEMPLARVSLQWLDPPRPLRSVADYRHQLVLRLVMAMLDRRFDRRGSATAPAFQSAYAEVQPAFGAAEQISVEAFSRSARWKEALRAVLEELELARRRGFSGAELGEAVRAHLAQARREADAESTRGEGEILADLKQALDEGHPPLSRAQALELDRRLLPTIGVAELSAAFAQRFDPRRRLIAVVLPRRDGLRVPSGGELAAVAANVEGRAVNALAPGDPIQKLLEAEPEPGTVASEREQPAAGVVSLTLSNGVRVHLRPMAGQKDRVALQITLAGGELLEDAATRGLSQVAALAFARPTTARLSAADIREYLGERNVDVWGCACDGDGLTLGVTTDANDIDEGMRLAHLVLTEGRIDPARLAVWKDRQSEALTRRRSSVEHQLDDAVAALLAGDDPRGRGLDTATVARIDVADGQRWLDRHLRAAPIEVALVGDLPLDRMRALALEYLGSLPARPADDPEMADRRRIPIKDGPLAETLTVETITQRAIVQLGWRGVDTGDERDRQLLDLAAHIISDRLIDELRGRRGLAYSFSCDSSPAVSLDGTGALVLQVSADPRKAALVAAVSRELVERLARDGPGDAELAMAQRQIVNQEQHDQQDPDFWADTLSTLELRGIDLDARMAESRRLPRYTAAEVREALARYVSDARRFQVVALPGGPAGSGYAGGAISSASAISLKRSNSTHAMAASRHSRASVLPRTAKTRSAWRAAGKSSRPSPT